MQWVKALAEERLPWQQYLIPPAENKKVKAQFLVDAVPLMLLVDEFGVVQKRITGFSFDSVAEFEKVIKSIKKLKGRQLGFEVCSIW
jgi:hypothetical protein